MNIKQVGVPSFQLYLWMFLESKITSSTAKLFQKVGLKALRIAFSFTNPSNFT